MESTAAEWVESTAAEWVESTAAEWVESTAEEFTAAEGYTAEESTVAEFTAEGCMVAENGVCMVQFHVEKLRFWFSIPNSFLHKIS